MIEILKEGIGYVKLTYPDSSIRVVKTTLNSDILISCGATIIRGFLYDLDRKIQVPYTKRMKIEIFKDRPVLEGVDELANRFI